MRYFGFLGFLVGGKMLSGELCRRIRIHRVISCGDAWLERGGEGARIRGRMTNSSGPPFLGVTKGSCFWPEFTVRARV